MTLTVYGDELDSHDACDRMDVACGLYWYCADHHGGQWSEEYRVLSTLGYRPGGSECGPEPDSRAADVYAALRAHAMRETKRGGELSVQDAESFVRDGGNDDDE